MHPAARGIAVAALLAVTALFAFPFFWMLTASFKTNAEIFDVWQIFPASWELRYFRELFSGRWIPYGRHYLNTLAIASLQTAWTLVASSAAGFVFSQYAFRWKYPLYLLCAAPLLLPSQVMVVPLFSTLNAYKLIDHLAAAALPGSVNGLGVIFFTEMTRRLPQELLDAARVEGASEYRLYTAVATPLLKPAWAAYGLVHFILAWHDHLVPLMVLTSPENLTLSVSLHNLLGSGLRVPYAVVMAGGLLTVIPTALLYLALGRHLRETLSQLTESVH